MAPTCVFLFAGEGAHSALSEDELRELTSLLASSPSFSRVDGALRELVSMGVEQFLAANLGRHSAPHSPVVTTVLNLLLADMWRGWGHEPRVVVGHSVGEIAAAHVAGLLSVEEALRVALETGKVAGALPGSMVHTTVPEDQLHLLPSAEMHLAAVNCREGKSQLSVSLCGPQEAADKWLARDETAVRLRPAHPWHHPAYATTEAFAASEWPVSRPAAAGAATFISAVQPGACDLLDGGYWRKWLTSPVQFQPALEAAARAIAEGEGGETYVVQIGAHPVLSGAVSALGASLAQHGRKLAAQCASMCRKVGGLQYLREQRALLKAAGLLDAPLRAALAEQLAQGRLDLPETPERGPLRPVPDVAFAEQGIASRMHVFLAARLSALFPGVEPHDLYRFTSLALLAERWDAPADSAAAARGGRGAAADTSLDVLGWGLHLPPDLHSSDAVWSALLRDARAIRASPRGAKGELPSGFLDPPFDGAASKAAAQASGVDAVEAGAMDPQHGLALKLTKEMFEHCGAEAEAAVLANKERVGVYLGLWQEANEHKRSAFAAIGSSLSAMAARVANAYDLQGPATTVNTACSSALVAVDAAMRDVRAGRVDYAIVGGINILASEQPFVDLKRASMLSPTARCHTFSAAADGYVRAEGGVVFLLRSTSAPAPALIPRATVIGSAVNQNSRRKPITAVDPLAQERVIRAACEDAGVLPRDLAAVEMHGTGTKLGDPVEISALAAVTAGPGAPCTLTAAKMHFGHLESAAGAVGMLKAVLMLEHGQIPPFAVDSPGVNPAVQKAMLGSRLRIPGPGGETLAPGSLVGVSSFGFAGSNAHIVVRGVGGDAPAPALASGERQPPRQAPAVTAPPPPAGDQGGAPAPLSAKSPAARAASPTVVTVSKICAEILGTSGPLSTSASLMDLGIDSLGFAELVLQLEGAFGDGVITVDDIMDAPSIGKIAAKLAGGDVSDTPHLPVGSTPTAPRAPPVQTADTTKAGQPAPASSTVQSICGIILGKPAKELGLDASLMDLGIDSLGFAELVLQLEGAFGDGVITVDDIMDAPSIGQIAAKLSGVASITVTATAPTVAVRAVHDSQRPAPVKDGPAVSPNPLSSAWPTSPGFRTPATPAATPLAAGVNSAVLERLSMLESACKELRSLVVASTPSGGELPSLQLAPDTAALVSQPAAEAPKPQPKLWIQTTHVGSLPRAPNASDTGKIISQQVDVGLDIINDGEWSRDNYVADMLQRIDGVGLGAGVVMSEGWSCVCEMPCATDMRTVPVYANRFTGANGLITLNPRRVAQANMACHARPTYVLSGAQQVRETVRPLLESLAAAGRSPSDSFWSAPSPGTMAVFCEDRFFQDHVMYVRALAEAMRPEYEAIAATGLQLQIDCPDLAMGRHTRHADLSDEAFLAVAEANVEALNYALENIPMEQVRIHVCWGNYAGPHHHDIAAAEIWPVVAKVKAKFILTEAANPRHAQDAKAFEDACARGLFEAPKVIVPGVIDTTAARVEHPALVAERLLRFVKAVGHPSRVIAGTDCGMATTAKSSAITSDIAWLKLEALVEGAALATKMLLEVSAPVPMPGPKLNPTPFRAAVICDAASAAPSELVAELQRRTSSTDLFGASAGKGVEATAVEAFEKLRWAVDFPLAVVAVGPMAQSAAVRLAALLRQASSGASRRPCELFFAGEAAASPSGVNAVKGSPPAMATAISTAMLANTGFDKRALLHGRNAKPLPEEVDVVVIGAGLLGLMAAARLKKNGHKVAVLEQRSIVGGIWSMYANSTSQVNSSEGGYNIKDLLPEGSPRKAADNRDHSTAAEILKDIAALGDSLADVIYTRVSVAKVLGTNGDYTTVVSDLNAGDEGAAAVVRSTGVVLAINDRVGLPRPLRVPGMNRFSGVMADGTSDALFGVSWQGKRVVVFGMGAFAVENVRTALESGASHVTVVARRLGTICPKMIDYLNFVKPWDEQYRHDPLTNIKQMKCWRDCYIKSGAVAPEVWPGKVKHDGHTISVSDIWFVAHHLGKMCTKVGTLESMVEGGCVLSDGSFLLADIVVGCIGFTRNTTFCEQLTGRTEVMHSNYLDKNMMYLADAEIDETAFNSFFGSSVLEYAKFYTNTYVQAFERPDALGSILWGAAVKRTPVSLRKWTQYIAVAQELIEKDTTMRGLAADQVRERTKHFYRTMSPEAFLEVNRLEWEELHERLNGSPVSKDKQLPYLFGAAPSWCAPANEVLP